jgi:hypothetical protein
MARFSGLFGGRLAEAGRDLWKKSALAEHQGTVSSTAWSAPSE